MPPPPPPLVAPRESILVVDDEAVVRAVISRQLGDRYAIEQAVDGLDALALIERDSQRFKLVILDLMMPRLTGDRLARALKSDHPDLLIIAMSAWMPEGEPMAGQFDPSTVDRFLQKPFRGDELITTVAELLATTRSPG